MTDRHFLSKIKKETPQKKLVFGKTAVGKEQPATLIKNSFVRTFHWKTNTKNRKSCSISQHTEAVIVNVKHTFHLESCVH